MGLPNNKQHNPNQPPESLIDNKFTWKIPDDLSVIDEQCHSFPLSNLSIFET